MCASGAHLELEFQGLIRVAEPCDVEAESIVKSLSADSDNDTSLALNNFTDHCPELTKKQLHTMNGFEWCLGRQGFSHWLCTQNEPFESEADAEFIA